MRKHALITAALLLPTAAAFSAGYQLNLQGLRQLAMGGGGTAMPWDASTIFYNPGGLARLTSLQAYASVQFIMPRVEYLNQTTGQTARTDNAVYTPFNIYVGGTVKGADRLGFGVGVYTPFGSGTTWDDNWTGRYVTQSIYLQSIFIQPTISYRISDGVSVGAGIIFATGHTDITTALPVQNSLGQDGHAELKGKASGMGYNIGISLQATEQLHFGISYRSRVDMRVKDGDATFSNLPVAVAGSFPNTSFDATLPLPEVLSVGAAWKPLKRFTVQLDFNLVGWKAYDSLAFNYADAVNGSKRTSSPRLYENRIAARLGGHYQATDALAIMLGAAYDPTPVRDGYVSPDLPDANRIILTAGLSYKLAKSLTLLAAVEYVSSEKRQATYDEAAFGGTYQTKAITPGIGLTYDF